MSEDEIIDKINYMINNWHRNVVEIDIQWIQGLLDLYKQEKEKNKNLIKQLQEQNTEIQDISKQLREKEQEDIKMRAKFVLSLDEYILKDKIREFIKKETFKGTYSFDLISAKRLIELLEEN